MSTVHTCDVCGKEEYQESTTQFTIHESQRGDPDATSVASRIDVCDDCLRPFQDVLNDADLLGSLAEKTKKSLDVDAKTGAKK